MKKRIHRFIRALTASTLVVAMLLPNVAYAAEEAADYLSNVEHSSLPVAEPIQDFAKEETDTGPQEEQRSLEELVQAGFVRLDQDGNVAMVKVSEESGLSTDEAMQLLSSTAQAASLESATDTKSSSDAILEELNISEADVETAAELHGSVNVFYGEINKLIRLQERENITERFSDLLTLLCNGYTLGQAQAALSAAQVMSLGLDELCAAKRDELQQAEEAPEEIDDIPLQTEDCTQAAINMGIPCSLLERYLIEHTEVAVSDISERYEEILVQDTSDAELEPQAVSADNALSENEMSAVSTAASGTVSYTPEQILENPFGYSAFNQDSINMGTGSYIYRETDLSIPGINGLDLNIERQFDYSSSYLQTPTSTSNSGYDNSYSIETVFDAYVSEVGSGDPYTSSIMLWTSYTFMGGTDTYNRLKNMEQQFKTSQLSLAIAQLVAMSEEVSGWVYGVRDDRNKITYAMVLRPEIEGVGSRFTNAFSNFGLKYNYMLNEYGLGQGWRLGFAAIERYFEGIDDPVCQRLITADGFRYKIDFTGDSLPSNLEGYTLEDLRLEKTSNGYPGATYTLFHKDGKCEYFDSNGRNIAIVDRFGNKITMEYTLSQGAVTQIKIIDTVGNIVLYKQTDLDPNTNHYLPGRTSSRSNQYDIQWTLSLNGKTIRTYYSYSNPNVVEEKRARILKAVQNEVADYTLYSTNVYTKKFNCIVTSPNTNDAQYARALLTRVNYPAGNELHISFSGKTYDRFNISGYTASNCISSLYEYYEIEDLDYTFYIDNMDFTIGDFTGYYSYIGNDSDYSSKVVHTRTRQVTPTETAPNLEVNRYIMTTKEDIYTYNAKGLLLSQEERPCTLLQDDQIKTMDDFIDLCDDSVVGTQWKTSYTYNGNSLPTKVSKQIYTLSTSTSRTESYQYSYDNKGNMLTQTPPNGQAVTYTYSPDYSIPLTKTYRQNASTTIVETNTLTSDKKSVAATTVTSNGSTVAKSEFVYDSNGRVTESKVYSDASHYTQQQFTYADNAAQIAEAMVLNVKDPTGALVAGSPGYSAGVIAQKSAYNDRGLPISQVDGNGNTVTIAYDASGRITKVTQPDGTYATYSYAYDPANGASSVTYQDEGGNKYIYKYDAFGRPTEIYDVTINKALKNWTYDSYGNMALEVTRSLVGADQRTYFHHDVQGRLVESGILNSDDTNTPLESYTYRDGQNQVVHTVYGETNAPTSTTTTYKDNMGYVTREDRTLGSTVYTDTYTNDYLGNCVQYKSAYTASIGGSFTTRTAYDYAGRTTAVTDAQNHTRTYSYDWQGNQISATDPKGTVSTNSYDAMGRILQATQPIDAASSGVSRYTYDGANNVIRTEDKLSDSPVRYSVTEYCYNDRNWLTQVAAYTSDTEANYTQYYYDDMGNVLRMYTGLSAPLTINGLDQISGGSENFSTTKYTYDRFGNPLTMTDPLGQSEAYEYDLTGAMLNKVDRNENVSQFTYNVRGQLLKNKILNTQTGEVLETTYTYARNGQKISESNETATVSFVYDALGRLTKETEGSNIKTYAYNAGDLRTSFALNVGGAEKLHNTYTYDTLGRLASVTSGNISASYAYDANGNQSLVTYGNGVTEAFSFNKANLVTQVSNKKGNTVLSQFDYTYDLAGHQLTKTDHTGKATSYTYDDMGQLLREAETKAGELVNEYHYQYTPALNRELKIENGLETGYFSDENNRLLFSSNDQEQLTYTYDGNGNMLSCVPDAMPTYYEPPGFCEPPVYEYNARNQLVSVSGTIAENTINEAYSYSPNGLRAHKRIWPNSITDYIWDGDQLVYEATHGVGQAYVRGLNLIASLSGDYYLYNAHGDVVQLTDGQGNVTQEYEYDAFGVEKEPDALGNNPFRYCGEYYDEGTGFYYLRARYYAPTLGRFIHEDPWREDTNWYIYCKNSPILYVDPSGYFGEEIWGYVKNGIRAGIHKGEEVAREVFEIDTTGIGASALDMYEENGIYHASFDCWQTNYGFNDIYDFLFDLGTSMERQKFPFTSGGENYILWAWKGDYINLGAGAELAIYKQKVIGGVKTPQWEVDKDLAMPMTLNLKDSSGNTIIDYAPEEKQWWITGFNPKYKNVQASDLTASFSVKFSKKMYEAFYNEYGQGQTKDNNWTFDKDSYTATLKF